MDTAAETFSLQAVGVIRNGVKQPFLTSDDSDLRMQGEIDAIREEVRQSYQAISHIVINHDMNDILDGIQDYSLIIVLYWGHKVPPGSRQLTQVHPMGSQDTPLKGVFSTCSPARPNPVLMSVVRLCGRERNVLQVSGLDAIDGSPVIDIKPYVKDFFPQKDTRIPEWMRQLCQEMS